ncbi:MAG: DegT/DnrJ/EryC1/StrS family aminotransferase [Eubacterium sp.]|nr:DegT/DnrJ/EryC1/StrS family aminotransferase [Eubacterium sp.]
MRYSLSNDTWDEKELEAIHRVIRSNRFTMGVEVEAYEKAFAKYFGAKYAVMSNSGSSANLLAISALIYSERLQRGDEVLVPAVSWSTTYFPLEQCGLKARLVDIDCKTLNMDLNKVENAITDDVKAILAVNLLGNPNDFERLREICKRYDLILIEDNCESMGAKYRNKFAGTFGILGTFSTFYSHHLCTMEGGVTVTDDEELYHYLLSIRTHGWTRQLPHYSSLYRKNENEFYESFQFIMPGYNLRPLEMEAAIGLEQIKKLDSFVRIRRDNADVFKRMMKADERFYTQLETGESSWFGFALILREEYSGERESFIEALRNAGIEVRPIVAGNFARQPAFKYMNASISGELVCADYIHENGFFVGNHSVKMEKEINLLIDVLKTV